MAVTVEIWKPAYTRPGTDERVPYPAHVIESGTYALASGYQDDDGDWEIILDSGAVEYVTEDSIERQYHAQVRPRLWNGALDPRDEADRARLGYWQVHTLERYGMALERVRLRKARAVRLCSGCITTLPITAFGVRSAEPDGYHRICRKCRAEGRG